MGFLLVDRVGRGALRGLTRLIRRYVLLNKYVLLNNDTKNTLEGFKIESTADTRASRQGCPSLVLNLSMLLTKPIPAHHGEDSFVITSRQRRIDWCLQCAFQGLVHGPLLESIMMFSSWEEDSLYPVSRCRATMQLSPHPNDIRTFGWHERALADAQPNSQRWLPDWTCH